MAKEEEETDEAKGHVWRRDWGRGAGEQGRTPHGFTDPRKKLGAPGRPHLSCPLTLGAPPWHLRRLSLVLELQRVDRAESHLPPRSAHPAPSAGGAQA